MSKPTTDRSGIAQTIKALKEGGWLPVRVDYGDGDDQPVSTSQEALDEVLAVDDAFLIFANDGVEGYVRFVMGNDPEEVVCDYTMNLDSIIDPLTRSWWD